MRTHMCFRDCYFPGAKLSGKVCIFHREWIKHAHGVFVADTAGFVYVVALGRVWVWVSGSDMLLFSFGRLALHPKAHEHSNAHEYSGIIKIKVCDLATRRKCFQLKNTNLTNAAAVFPTLAQGVCLRCKTVWNVASPCSPKHISKIAVSQGLNSKPLWTVSRKLRNTKPLQ